MTTLALGPGDLAKSLGQDFFLPREALVQLQLYAYQAAALPVDAEELRESLFGTPSGKEAEPGKDVLKLVTRLATVYAGMARHADHWHQDIHPGIVGTAHLVSQYAVKSNRMYQTLLQTIRGLHRDPLDAELRIRLQRLAERLATEATRSATGTQTVLEKLGPFVTAAEGDRQALEPVNNDLLEKYNAKDKRLKEIDDELAAAENRLAAANTAYANDVAATATAATYVAVVNIFMGFTIVAAFAVGLVASIDSAKAKADIDREIEKIRELKKEQITALRVRAALRLAQRAVDEITASARTVQPALARAIQGWEQLDRDIDRLKTAAADDPASVPLLFREAELEAARVAWQRLARAADDFRVHAYIHVFPEKAEDEAGAESKDENPAGKVGADAPGEEAGHGES